MRLTKNDYYFEMIFGPMFAGKTTELFKRYSIAKRFASPVKLYRFTFDNRYGQGNASHDNIQFNQKDVELVKNLDSLIKKITEQDSKVILLEETQFYKPMQRLADYIEDLVHEKHKIVIATALPTDFKGQAFNEIGKLLAIADKHTRLYAQCTYEENGEICGRPASKTQRMNNSQELVVVGGADIYEARCRKHFRKPQK